MSDTPPPRGWVRPDWTLFYLNLARTYASQAACLRSQVGAILVKNNRVIATGMNGVPSGWVHCTDGGCPRGLVPRGDPLTGRLYHNCVGRHAEQNLFEWLDDELPDVELGDASLYVTREPCASICQGIILEHGVGEVWVPDAHGDPSRFHPGT